MSPRRGLAATVILGELDGAASPGTVHTPLVGADLTLADGRRRPRCRSSRTSSTRCWPCPARPTSTACALAPGSLLYLGCGRRELPLRAAADGRLLLLGGEPFEEEIVMWWNFVARTGEEIAEAREAWQAELAGPTRAGRPGSFRHGRPASVGPALAAPGTARARRCGHRTVRCVREPGRTAYRVR